ncbi:MAG: rhodanese-like domain-containing protein [Betaproteobacteria bacterium]
MKCLLALSALILSCASAHAEIINIDNAQLARLSASGVPVIDVRTEGEWKSTGIIAGSKTLTFFDETGRSNPAQWLEQVKKLAGPDQPLILICRSGSRSQAVARFLSEQSGYATVYNAGKGIIGWSGEGRAVVPIAQH